MRRTLAIVLALGGAASLLWMSSESSPVLALRHALQSRLKPLSVVTTVEVDATGPLRMFLNPQDEVITPWLWSGGVWEANETHWFVESLRPGDVVVDVGANVGYYTILAARLVGENGRVYAFEPDPTSFEILQRNVRVNALRNVVVEQKAVSNRAGTIRLYLAESNKGDHRIYQPEGEQRPSVDVEAVALDDYFEGVEEALDFVKVDTQGAEAVILEGMLGLVKHSPEIVMAFEFSPSHLAGFGSTARDLLAPLDTLKLQMFDLGMGGPGLRPLRPIAPEQLLRRYPPTSRFFTNLLLVKGRADLLARIDGEASAPGDR